MASIPRYLGRMAIGKLVPLGWSTRKIINHLSKTTGTYRRTNMLSDIRESYGVALYGDKIKGLAVNVTPPKDLMVETELRRPRKYRVFGTAKYFNEETGYTMYNPVSFYDDKLRTKEQWEREFIRQQKVSTTEDVFSIEELDIYSIQHYEGAFY